MDLSQAKVSEAPKTRIGFLELFPFKLSVFLKDHS